MTAARALLLLRLLGLTARAGEASAEQVAALLAAGRLVAGLKVEQAPR
jgi:hypothetical protein